MTGFHVDAIPTLLLLGRVEVDGKLEATIKKERRKKNQGGIENSPKYSLQRKTAEKIHFIHQRKLSLDSIQESCSCVVCGREE